jgi:hypothetical protein|tara:strand:+ start:5625 stop:5747 length:123 start_codon:yes stop_codon:yes gene_type:complete
MVSKRSKSTPQKTIIPLSILEKYELKIKTSPIQEKNKIIK